MTRTQEDYDAGLDRMYADWRETRIAEGKSPDVPYGKGVKFKTYRLRPEEEIKAGDRVRVEPITGLAEWIPSLLDVVGVGVAIHDVIAPARGCVYVTVKGTDER